MTKGGGKAESEDWECCEKCSFGFTILVGVIFLLGGLAMSTYAGLWMFSDIAVEIQGLEVLEAQTELIQWAIFVVGICIAGTALLGMIMAGCAKCAANPDGVNDGCEKCCTTTLSIVYLIILSLLLAATLAIAGGLSYYAVTVSEGASDNCPYPASDTTSRFVSADDNGTPPDALECPLDLVIYEAFFDTTVATTFADGWISAQDLSVTCGYYCDVDNFCSPSLGSQYDVQTTGTFCTQNVTSDIEEPASTVYQGSVNGVDQAFRVGEPTSMPYRPTLYSLLNTLLIPFLVVWWLIFVLALLLIIAACVMCVRKKKTEKKATYKPK